VASLFRKKNRILCISLFEKGSGIFCEVPPVTSEQASRAGGTDMEPHAGDGLPRRNTIVVYLLFWSRSRKIVKVDPSFKKDLDCKDFNLNLCKISISQERPKLQPKFQFGFSFGFSFFLSSFTLVPW